jgi:hypothetical protein
MSKASVFPLLLGPFLINPLPPYPPLPTPLSTPIASPVSGSNPKPKGVDEEVAAVLVSMGGGRIGTATRDEDEDAVVAVLLDEEVEAFRDMPGVIWGRRGKFENGGVGGFDVGMGL